MILGNKFNSGANHDVIAHLYPTDCSDEFAVFIDGYVMTDGDIVRLRHAGEIYSAIFPQMADF